MTIRYAFQLGREDEIAVAEIHAVLAALGVSFGREERHSGYLLLASADPLDTTSLMRRLGGTIKIAREIPTTGNIVDAMASYLDAVLPEEKIHFSVSGGRHLGLEVKKRLKEMGRSVRYIEPKNTATILHNQLVERQSDLFIIGNALFVTTAIQPFEEFSARDYGRPNPDSRRGMLPPKLARILLNLSGADKSATVLDPFCGSGTTIMEGLLLGFAKIIGSDLSEKAILDSQKNTAWIREMYALRPEPELFVCDVRTLPERLAKSRVDAIVTEPYLGKPQAGQTRLVETQNQMRELADLYKSAFASFAFLLAPGGVVVWIMPAFRRGDEWLRLDAAAIIGKQFAAVPLGRGTPYLLYARDDQHVGREIWKFRKLGN